MQAGGYGLLSLSGHAAAASRKAIAPGIGASTRIERPPAARPASFDVEQQPIRSFNSFKPDLERSIEARVLQDIVC
jgi:hypothetical protein